MKQSQKCKKVYFFDNTCSRLLNRESVRPILLLDTNNNNKLIYRKKLNFIKRVLKMQIVMSLGRLEPYITYGSKQIPRAIL